MARDPTFYTGVALVNIGASPQGVVVHAFGPGGRSLGSKQILLGAREKVVTTVPELLTGGQIQPVEDVDWLFVEADVDIVGFELFGTFDGERLAGLEASSALRSQLCYPFLDANVDVAHGISVVNVNNQATTVSFTLYDDQGLPIGAPVDVPLGANEKFISTVSDLFPGVPMGTIPGWLGANSNMPLAGFELFINTANGQQMGAVVAQ